LSYQVEYHVYQQPRQLVEYCREEGIVFQGYSPLAKGQALGDPTVLKLAEKYGRTPAQICIRWNIQVMVSMMSMMCDGRQDPKA
jgi:diketogulonate reductase-like aldo/keto reductase